MYHSHSHQPAFGRPPRQEERDMVLGRRVPEPLVVVDTPLVDRRMDRLAGRHRVEADTLEC